MQPLTVPATDQFQPQPSPASPVRHAARWLVTFAGFPLGGLAAHLSVGPVDSVPHALLGGLLTGAVVGAAQAWGLRLRRPESVHWVAATAAGLMVGLTAGAVATGFRTDLRSLVALGAVSGLAVGAAQALVLRRRLGRIALGWPGYLAAVWALGWAITTAVGVQVEDGFTVFGSSGALTVAALTTALPVFLSRRDARTARSAS